MPEVRDALMSAVRGGDLAHVRRLAADTPPAELDAAGPDGRTPMMLAAAAGAEEMVALLLELGADPALSDGAGRTAADLAFENGHTDLGQRLGPNSDAERVLR